MLRDIVFLVGNIGFKVLLAWVSIRYGPDLRDWSIRKKRDKLVEQIARLKQELSPMNSGAQLSRMLGHSCFALVVFVFNMGADLLIFMIIQQKEFAVNLVLFSLLNIDVLIGGVYLCWVGVRFWDLYQQHPTSPKLARLQQRLERLNERLIAG